MTNIIRNKWSVYCNHKKRCQNRRRGQAWIEFAFVSTLLIFLTMGLMQYSRWFNTMNQLTSICRDGGRYAAKHGAESQTKYGSTTMSSDNAIKAYIADLATDTKLIDPTDLTVTISPAVGSTARASGNPITVTIVYDLNNKLTFAKVKGLNQPGKNPSTDRFTYLLPQPGNTSTSVTMIIE